MLQGILVFASVMATLGLQVVLESIRSLLSHVCVLTSLPSMLYSFFYLCAFVISKGGSQKGCAIQKGSDFQCRSLERNPRLCPNWVWGVRHKMAYVKHPLMHTLPGGKIK